MQNGMLGPYFAAIHSILISVVLFGVTRWASAVDMTACGVTEMRDVAAALEARLRCPAAGSGGAALLRDEDEMCLGSLRRVLALSFAADSDMVGAPARGSSHRGP
jgi:hypothetical protein